MAYSYVSQTLHNGISYIEFGNPPHNALPSELLLKLESEIIAAGSNSEAKVVVLQSAGDRTFCAGASFNELVHIETKAQGEQFFTGFAKVINAMRKCPKFIIAKVQGKAVGGGVGLAAAADYCLASAFAAVKLSELSIGIGPFVIEPAVTRKIGTAAMAELSINAEQFFNADWAKTHGLFAEVLPNKQELDQATLTLAETLKTYNPEAVEIMKSVLWQDTAHWDSLLLERAAISGKLVLSDFTKTVLIKYKTTE